MTSDLPDSIRDTQDLRKAYHVSVDVEFDQAEIRLGDTTVAYIVVRNGVAYINPPNGGAFFGPIEEEREGLKCPD